MFKPLLMCAILALAAPLTALACPHASVEPASVEPASVETASAQHDATHKSCDHHAQRRAEKIRTKQRDFEAKGFEQQQPSKVHAHTACAKHASDDTVQACDHAQSKELAHAGCPHHAQCAEFQTCDHACHDQDCPECAEHCGAQQH